MKPSIMAFNLIAEFESNELTAYRDSGGVLTIGRGHTAGVYEGQVINEAVSDAYFAIDVASGGRRVDEVLGRANIMQHEYDALTSFCFNVKLGVFFEALRAENLIAASQACHLLMFVRAGAMISAANEFPKWDHCDGKVLPGLARRRAVEQAMFMGIPRPDWTRI